MTRSEHLDAARTHEARALALDEQAVRHDKDADELASSQGYDPMKHKWPSMSQGPIDLCRERAAEARREAAKCRESAARHRAAAGPLPK